MFKYLPVRRSQHLADQSRIAKLIWILFIVSLLVAMVKPVHASGTIFPEPPANRCVLRNWSMGYVMGYFSSNTAACASVGATVAWGTNVGDCTNNAGYFQCSALSAAHATCTATTCTCSTGYQPNFTATSCELPPVCPAGQKPHPNTGCMLDCPAGTYPNVSDTACEPDSSLGCGIKPLMPLPIEATDQCSAALENVSYTQAQRDAVCGTLTAAMQTEVACLSEKLVQKGIAMVITAEVRSIAYQAHFRDVWDKMRKLIKLTEDDPVMEAACISRRAELAAEKGCDRAGACTKILGTETVPDCTPGGRNHCFNAKPALATGAPSHAWGKAIDVKASNVNALINALSNPPPPKTVKQFVTEPGTQNPTVCPVAPKLQWGGAWPTNPEKVHFYLP